MSDLGCPSVELFLSSGAPHSHSVTAHLARCSSCRAHASSLEAIERELTATAAMKPPRLLDRTVRAAFREESNLALRRTDKPPVLVLIVAVASLVGFASALCIVLKDMGWGNSAVPMTILATTAYLATAFVATLPLLFGSARPIGSVPIRRTP